MRLKSTLVFFIAATLVIFNGCSRKVDDKAQLSAATDILTFSIIPGQDQASINGINHSVVVKIPESFTSGSNRSAVFILSDGARAHIGNIPQVSGSTQNDFDKTIPYIIEAADRTTAQTWTVNATNNDYSLQWGLGNFVRNSASSNRSYEWYIDQKTSGTFAGVNCGPASVTMAIKWADSSFPYNAEDARNRYESSGGWWFTYDIDNYLSDYQIPHAIIPLSANSLDTRQIIRNQIDNNQIVILCIDMDLFRAATHEEFRVDKFYSTTPSWGHFFVVKGYKEVGQETFFEVYDPYSFGLLNSDNSLKGRDRFYRYEDIAASTRSWWNFAIVVAQKGHALDTDIMRAAVSSAVIPAGYGGVLNK